MTLANQGRLVALAELVRDVQQTEHKYLLHGPRHDPVHNPWMPYQPADFIGIVWECLPELSHPFFLDVGCGPGTKMAIARDLFGFTAFGVESDEHMASEAAKALGSSYVKHADAMKLSPEYIGQFNLVWLYRPFRDPMSEYRLEQHVIDCMQPGAILAGSSWETDVPSMGWMPIVDDCLISPDGKQSIIRGAWKKPAGGSS